MKGLSSEMILTIGILIAAGILLLQLRAVFYSQEKIGKEEVIVSFANDLESIIDKTLATTGSSYFSYKPEIKSYVLEISSNKITITDKVSENIVSFIRSGIEFVPNKIEDQEYISIIRVFSSGADTYLIDITSGKIEITSTSTTTTTIVTTSTTTAVPVISDIEMIAREAIGHPYCLGAGEWDIDSTPPFHSVTDPCPNLVCCESSCPILPFSSGQKCPTDCSAYTKWVFNRYGHIKGLGELIRYRSASWQGENSGTVVDGNPDCGSSCAVTGIDFSALSSGDLVFFCGTYDSNWNGLTSCSDDGVTHVGIYLGNREMIHASSSNGVIVVSLESSSLKNNYVGARRLV